MIQKRWRILLLAILTGIIIQVTYTTGTPAPVSSILETGESINLLDQVKDTHSFSLPNTSYTLIVMMALLGVSYAWMVVRPQFMYFLISVFYQSNYFRKNIIISS